MRRMALYFPRLSIIERIFRNLSIDTLAYLLEYSYTSPPLLYPYFVNHYAVVCLSLALCLFLHTNVHKKKHEQTSESEKQWCSELKVHPSCNRFQLQSRGHSLNSLPWKQLWGENKRPRAASNKMIWVDLGKYPAGANSGKWSPFCSDAEQGIQVTWPNWEISSTPADPVLLISASCRPRASPCWDQRAPILAGTRSSSQSCKSEPWLAAGTSMGEENSGDGEVLSHAPLISADQLLPSQCL